MTLPRSLTPDQLRRDLKALQDRLTVIERGAGSTTSTTGLTSPIALTDIDVSGETDGDVLTVSGGVLTSVPPTGGTTLISGSVNVTMTGDSGTATFFNAAVDAFSLLTASIAGVTKSDHDPEDHMLEELLVYCTNQIGGQVDVVIVSPNGGSFGDYQVNILGV